MANPPSLWHSQGIHGFSLLVLLIVTSWLWLRMGSPYPGAFWLAVMTPVVHQLYVWCAWRTELNRGTVSRTLGFRGYVVCFFILFGARFVTLAYLAWLDRGSLGLAPAVHVLLTIALLAPGLYAGYSVKRYFGMLRASGADHFDPRYRAMPMVDKGIFRYTNNGMYLYAFMIFWAIAIGFNSSAATLVAAFSHAYIWVHFHTVEKPDMDYLYAHRDAREPDTGTSG